MMDIQFVLNGKPTRLTVAPERALVDVLREELHLTGTKRGCGEGECGTCTVLLDDKAVHACLTMIGQVDGHRVTTIEGVGRDERIAPLVPAFVESMAIQCGYCTPGMILSAAGLLLANPDPTEDEIRTAISGNICRCSAYEQIVRAVKVAAQARREAMQ